MYDKTPNHPVQFAIDYPDRPLDRVTTLLRPLFAIPILVAIPHYLALLVLDLGVIIATITAWVAIILTGRHPRLLFNYTVGVMRWHNRVTGYAFALVTDQYPPFRLTA
ncbi:MAG: DUF4389 domain-containing protein [Acidimicrobiales bacterium]